MRRKMYPSRMRYDYLLPFFFLVGSCSNILHSFKLEATSLTLHSSHTVTQPPAKSPAGQRPLLQAELDLGLLETPRAPGLEEGVPPGAHRGAGDESQRILGAKGVRAEEAPPLVSSPLNMPQHLGTSARCHNSTQRISRQIRERLGVEKTTSVFLLGWFCMRTTLEFLGWPAPRVAPLLGPRGPLGAKCRRPMSRVKTWGKRTVIHTRAFSGVQREHRRQAAGILPERVAAGTVLLHAVP